MAFPLIAPLLVTFCMGVTTSLTNICVEAFVDTTTDFIIDKADETFEKMIPNVSENKYFKQFTNQVRMGAATATNARIMSSAMRSQQKIEEKLEERKAEITKKYKEKYAQLDSLKRKGLAGKRKKNLKEQYNKELDNLDSEVKRIYQMRDTANNEAYTFNAGTGILKQGHDGTIQNMKPSPTAELSRDIRDLLNSQGYYADKRGVSGI